MATAVRWTSADLKVLPQDGKRYEVIDGELHVSRQPSWEHQLVGQWVAHVLAEWSLQSDAGLPNTAPGVIFGEEDDVAPDVVRVSAERLATILAADGKLHGAPDLAVEVLSPGVRNERRDRAAKLKTYSTHGVREYWIVDWQRREVQVFRRVQAVLELVATLREGDAVTSPLLPGFSTPVERFFVQVPAGGQSQP